MLVMVVFFIAFRWIHLSTPLIRLFLLVLILLLIDRKSGSAGMPRPISYAVFCLKKKKKLAAPTEAITMTETVPAVLASRLDRLAARDMSVSRYAHICCTYG